MTNEHESNLQEELWQCTLCPAAFGLRPDLMEHHAFTHNGVQNYVCTECLLDFDSAEKLSIHKLNIHSGRRGEEGGGSTKVKLFTVIYGTWRGRLGIKNI